MECQKNRYITENITINKYELNSGTMSLNALLCVNNQLKSAGRSSDEMYWLQGWSRLVLDLELILLWDQLSIFGLKWTQVLAAVTFKVIVTCKLT